MSKKCFFSSLMMTLLLCFCLSSAANADTTTYMKDVDNFIMMYDSSSSMKAAYNDTGMRALDAERTILTQINDDLPEQDELNWNAGIYSFTPGFGVDAFKTYMEMSPYNKADFAAALDKMPAKAKGVTLLQVGLESLDPILESAGGRTAIFLFTDGQYTPNSGKKAPAQLVKMLDEKYDICLYVIDTDKGKENNAKIDAIGSEISCTETLEFATLLGDPKQVTDYLYTVQIEEEPVVRVIEEPVVVAPPVFTVLFGSNKATVASTYTNALNDLSMFMQSNPNAKMTLTGYTDNTGSKRYNRKLAQRRAEAVKKYMVDTFQISSDRIMIDSAEIVEDAAKNRTRADRAQNRRVECEITLED